MQGETRLETAHRVERLFGDLLGDETAPTARWLPLAHQVCTALGIPAGHIQPRLQALRTAIIAGEVRREERSTAA